MSGHESAGPLRACWLSSAGTLTCIKSLVTVLRAFLPPHLNDSQ
jgi:hypothetical protein